MSVQFHDYSMQVKAALEEAAIKYLHEAAGELVSQTNRNLDKERGRWHTEQKEQWQYRVDESKLEATIGNPMERAIWTEFGTGSYAEGGKGRKGWWVYVKYPNSTAGSGSSYAYNGGKSYTFEEAKRVMAMLKADGLDAHITNGQAPKRPFRSAYTSLKPKLIKRAEQVLKGTMK